MYPIPMFWYQFHQSWISSNQKEGICLFPLVPQKWTGDGPPFYRPRRSLQKKTIIWKLWNTVPSKKQYKRKPIQKNTTMNTTMNTLTVLKELHKRFEKIAFKLQDHSFKTSVVKEMCKHMYDPEFDHIQCNWPIIVSELHDLHMQNTKITNTHLCLDGSVTEGIFLNAALKSPCSRYGVLSLGGNFIHPEPELACFRDLCCRLLLTADIYAT